MSFAPVVGHDHDRVALNSRDEEAGFIDDVDFFNRGFRIFAGIGQRVFMLARDRADQCSQLLTVTRSPSAARATDSDGFPFTQGVEIEGVKTAHAFDLAQ